MNALTTMWIVMCKELRDILRDRRTLVLTLVMGPLLFPAIMLGMGALTEKKLRTQSEKELEVPTIGLERAPNLVAFLATQGIRAVPAPEDLEQAIREQRVEVGMHIPEEFAADWRAGRPALVEVLVDTTQRDSAIPASRVQGALRAYGAQVGALRLLARGVDASVAQALNPGTRDVATDAARRGRVLAFISGACR